MRRGIQVYALHFEDEQSIILGENGVTSIEPDPDHRGRFTVFVDGVKTRVVDTDDSVDYCLDTPLQPDMREIEALHKGGSIPRASRWGGEW